MVLVTRREHSSRTTSRETALAVLCAGQLMMILDQTIVNVALLTIQSDLRFTQSNLAWVVNAYLIPFGGLLLLAGRLGDLVGRKRIFLVGLTVFTAASLLCGASTTAATLIAARAAQGVGAALGTAVILGMIVTLFPEADRRAKSIGVYAFVEAIGGSLGGLMGGAITQSFGWHGVFLVNVPIGIATIIIAMRVLDGDARVPRGRSADVVSAGLITTVVMFTVYTVIEVPTHGWASLHTAQWGVAAAVLLLAFVVRQDRMAVPLMPLRMLRSRTVGVANLILGLLVAAMFGFVFLGSLFLERVLGYSALKLGLALAPVPIMIALFALGFSSRLIGRFSERRVLWPGLIAIALGLYLMSLVPDGARYVPSVLPAMLLLGAGFGLSMPALANLALSSATAEDAGLASGIFNTTQQVGGAIGLAVLVTVAASRTQALLMRGARAEAAMASGYRRAFGIGACLVVTALVLSGVWLRRREASRVDVAGEGGAAAPCGA